MNWICQRHCLSGDRLGHRHAGMSSDPETQTVVVFNPNPVDANATTSTPSMFGYLPSIEGLGPDATASNGNGLYAYGSMYVVPPGGQPATQPPPQRYLSFQWYSNTQFGIGETMQVGLVADQVTATYASQHGYTIAYQFVVGGTNWPTATTFPSPSGLFTIPAMTAAGQQETVNCNILFQKNGVTVGSWQIGYVKLSTPTPPPSPANQNFFEALYQLGKDIFNKFPNLIKTFGKSLLDAAYTLASVLNKALSGEGLKNLLDNLEAGVKGALSSFLGNLGSSLGKGLAQWLLGSSGASTLTLLLSSDWNGLGSVKSFLLQYGGLTWDNIFNIIGQQLGYGNLDYIQNAFLKVTGI